MSNLDLELDDELIIESLNYELEHKEKNFLY